MRSQIASEIISYLTQRAQVLYQMLGGGSSGPTLILGFGWLFLLPCHCVDACNGMQIWRHLSLQVFSCLGTFSLLPLPSWLDQGGIFQIYIVGVVQYRFLSWHLIPMMTIQNFGRESFCLSWWFPLFYWWSIEVECWVEPCTHLGFWYFCLGKEEGRSNVSHLLWLALKEIWVGMMLPCDFWTQWPLGGQWFYPLPIWVPLAIVIRLRGASPCVAKVDGFQGGGKEYFPFWILSWTLGETEVVPLLPNQCWGWTFSGWGSSSRLL